MPWRWTVSSLMRAHRTVMGEMLVQVRDRAQIQSFPHRAPGIRLSGVALQLTMEDCTRAESVDRGRSTRAAGPTRDERDAIGSPIRHLSPKS